jgi:hypothetical protein
MPPRIAIIDSGVNPAHPHVGSLVGGIQMGRYQDSAAYLDYLGHGTAVAGAIHGTCPQAGLLIVKVFDRTLATRIDILIRALEWSLDQDVNLINLSLGTSNAAHAVLFQPVVDRAVSRGVCLISAAGQLPGDLPGVLRVRGEPLPREEWRRDGETFVASLHPRPIPGRTAEENLAGVSFAVANFTGLLARRWHEVGPAAVDEFRAAR